MATGSDPPPGQLHNPEPVSSKPVEGYEQEEKGDATYENPGKPSFVIPQPMREDQVQNAVKFLSHPKVRGSPIIYRRSFLEKKGLTREEIDESFRRVPDPPSNAANVEASTITEASQPKSSSALQNQAPVQPPQPAATPVTSVSMVPSLQQSRFQWSHAFLAVGVLAASGAGTAVFFKKTVAPRLKDWIRKVVAEEGEREKDDKSSSTLLESTAEAAKAFASAAALMAKSNQELLLAKAEERRFDHFVDALMEKMDAQKKEIKSLVESVRKLESASENAHSQDKLIELQPALGNGTTNNMRIVSQLDQSNSSLSSMHTKHIQVNGASDVDYGTGRPSSAPAFVEPQTAPYSKSYMEILAMVQRGERPPNIKEINDMPPNPNQQPSKPLLAPRPKPWEATPQHSQQKPSYGIQSQASGEWLRPEGQENGTSSQLNGRTNDASEPWWRKKTAKISEIEAEGEEHRQFPYAADDERSRRRGWVPPQPPSVVMAEAADAIRRPKPSVQNQQSVNEQPLARSEDGEDGTTRASDPVVDSETSINVAVDLNQSEIQEERADAIEVM